MIQQFIISVKMATLQLVLLILATACIHVQAQSICNVTIYDVVRELSNGLTKDVTNVASELKEMMKKQEEKIEDLASDMKACCKDKPRDCAALYMKGKSSSGVHTIYPYGGNGIRVYCDMETAGGGWTVFQKRYNGEVDFFKGWKDYVKGFGNTEREYWLGLKHIDILTKLQPTELYVGITDFHLGSRYAKYGRFSVANEFEQFRLTVGSYSGNAGDSLTHHNGQKFSTKDEDNDKSSTNCSIRYHGAWWYVRCHKSNLNGRFSATKVTDASFMTWSSLQNGYYSLKASVMMIRPSIF